MTVHESDIMTHLRALLAFAVLLVACGPAAPAGDQQRHPLVGTTVPTVTLPRLGGGELSLEQPGRVVLVNFWGTYCPPCEAEMPDLERLYERYGPDRFTVLAVNVEEPAGHVAAFIERHGLTFPVLLSSDASVKPAFHLVGLPTSWLVAPDGTIRAVWPGPLPLATAAAQIEALLAARANSR